MALVGGSRPQEGNIMVHGQPVCDDGSAYRAANARVVCRFTYISNDAVQSTIANFANFQLFCLVSLFAHEIVLSVSFDILQCVQEDPYRAIFCPCLQGPSFQCFG